MFATTWALQNDSKFNSITCYYVEKYMSFQVLNKKASKHRDTRVRVLFVHWILSDSDFQFPIQSDSKFRFDSIDLQM